MGFKNNFAEANNGGLKPEGDYECIIMAIEEKTNKNGKTCLNITYVIRNDVPGQKYGNACLFQNIWKRKDPTELDMQVNGYGFGQIMALGKAARLPDGKDYDSLKQFCEELLKKCVRVNIIHDDFNDRVFEKVNYLTETKFPDCKHVFKESKATQNGFAQPAQNQQFAGNSTSEFESVVADDDGVPF